MLKPNKTMVFAGALAGFMFASPGQSQSLFSEEFGNLTTQKFVPQFSEIDQIITHSNALNVQTPDARALFGQKYENQLSSDPINVQPQRALTAFNEPVSAYRFDGEDSVMRFTFEHNLQTGGGVGELQLAYKNAVSVMPEASNVEVSVNGQPVGTFTISSPSHFKTETFSVPASALINGTNVVQMRAIQRHRVDCSFDATYELWTEIDHSKTGFFSEGTNDYNSFSSLRKIARSENGLTDLRLVLPSHSNMDVVNEALPLVQTLALAIGRDDISVTVSDRAGMGAGIDVFLATMDAPYTNQPLVDQVGQGLTIMPSVDQRRAAVVLKASSAQQIHAQLLSAIQGPLKPLIDEAINANKHGEINATAGNTYKLSDAGYQSKSFSGRLFKTSFNLNLPGDFYPAEYATIDLGLHAATSPGLKPQSQLLVRVNGQIVKSLPMRDTDGQVFEDRRVELPMRAFRPGTNQIEILAELEKKSDEACVYTERNETAPRFILLDNTEITVPELARVSRLPDLSVLAGTSYPYNQDDGLNIYVAHSDSRTLSSALTMLTKMSVTTKSPFNAQLLLGRPDAADAENKLVIAPRRAFNQSQHSALEGSRKTANRVVFHDADWLPDLVTTASTNTIPLPRVTEATSQDLLRAFKQDTKRLADDLSLTARVQQKMEDVMFKFNSWLRYEPVIDKAPTGDIEARRADFMQTFDPKTNSVATWLTAETPEDVVRASMILANPAIWTQVHGSDVMIDLKSKKTISTQASAYHVHAFTDKTPGNMRRLAAAWFSDNFVIYVAVVILFIGLFAGWLGRAVKQMGVRTDG